MKLTDKIREARDFIRKITDFQPDIALILGSGLGTLAEEIEDPVIIEYAGIPHFPVSTVEGHAGRLVLGTLEGKKVAAMQGAFTFMKVTQCSRLPSLSTCSMPWAAGAWW